jgi:hypothetical protein
MKTPKSVSLVYAIICMGDVQLVELENELLVFLQTYIYIYIYIYIYKVLQTKRIYVQTFLG